MQKKGENEALQGGMNFCRRSRTRRIENCTSSLSVGSPVGLTGPGQTRVASPWRFPQNSSHSVSSVRILHGCNPYFSNTLLVKIRYCSITTSQGLDPDTARKTPSLSSIEEAHALRKVGFGARRMVGLARRMFFEAHKTPTCQIQTQQ